MKNIHTQNFLRDRRKLLRNNATPEEKLLWKYLKGSKIGYKFQRQHSIGPYIVDFYCSSQKLIIELDGSQHNENRLYDKDRTDFLETLGFKILRFWNYEIDRDIKKIISIIKQNFI